MTAKPASFASVLAVTMLAVVGVAPSAHAGPGRTFTLTVDRHVVHSGERFTVTAGASIDCAWVLEWNGDRRTSPDRAPVEVFSAPQVTRPTRIPLHGTCFYASSSDQRSSHRAEGRSATLGASAQSIRVTVPPSWRHTATVTVLPAGSAVHPPHSAGAGTHPGGGLAGTGGPALWMLVAGLGAVLLGGASARASARRPRTPRLLASH